MSAVEFPPAERVNLYGTLSRGELIGAAVATTVFGAGIAVGLLIEAAVVAVLALVWTFAPTRRRPLRVLVPAWLRWRLRRGRDWAAPLCGQATPPPFLRGVEVQLTDDGHGGEPVGVVVNRRAYTVMFRVDRAALTYAAEAERAQALAGWGEVLGALCVERGTELTAERVGWTDIHRAADPAALVRYHDTHGIPGPASEDYAAHVATFGALAAAHEIVVWATITQAGRLRVAKRSGLSGTPGQVMRAAAVRAGTALRGELADRGFTVGALMTPAEIGRVLLSAMDPYRPSEPVSSKERFSLAEQTIPDSQVSVERDVVMIDRALHRVFATEWPTVPVDGSWLWNPLAAEGPKIVTAVFEPIPPSRADRQRNSRRSIGHRNNAAAATERDGHVHVKNIKKVDSLHRAERAVSEGHAELDGYLLIVVSATSRDELELRCNTLRRRLRESGHASVRELSGLHDFAFAAALPVGAHVAANGG